MIDIEVKCDNCIKLKTNKCPNSNECYSLKNKPYFYPVSIEYKPKFNPIYNFIKKLRG